MKAELRPAVIRPRALAAALANSRQQMDAGTAEGRETRSPAAGPSEPLSRTCTGAAAELEKWRDGGVGLRGGEAAGGVAPHPRLSDGRPCTDCVHVSRADGAPVGPDVRLRRRDLRGAAPARCVMICADVLPPHQDGFTFQPVSEAASVCGAAAPAGADGGSSPPDLTERLCIWAQLSASNRGVSGVSGSVGWRHTCMLTQSLGQAAARRRSLTRRILH